MMDADRFSEINMTDENNTSLLAHAEQNPPSGKEEYPLRNRLAKIHLASFIEEQTQEEGSGKARWYPGKYMTAAFRSNKGQLLMVIAVGDVLGFLLH